MTTHRDRISRGKRRRATLGDELQSHPRRVGAVPTAVPNTNIVRFLAWFCLRAVTMTRQKGWYMNESNSGLFSDHSASEQPEAETKTAEQLAAEREKEVAERSNTDTAEQRQSQLFSG